MDSGVSWKRVLGLRGNDNRVRFIYIDTTNPKDVYVCTERGVYRSQGAGKKGGLFCRGGGEQDKAVFCIQSGLQNPTNIYIGTRRGLFIVQSNGGETKKAAGLPDTAVYSILQVTEKEPTVFITIDKGIYKSTDGAEHWQRVFVASEERLESPGETTLEQFDIEEFSTAPAFSNLVFLRSQGAFYAATSKGVFQGSNDASSWQPLKGQTLPAQKINFIEKSSKTFYAATDRGIFQWDPDAASFREVYEGLDSKEINTLFYSASGDYLLAGTKKGIFKLSYPELTFNVPQDKEKILPSTHEILARFKQEPSIEEIQKAAIQYAEVHPSKIEEW